MIRAERRPALNQKDLDSAIGQLKKRQGVKASLSPYRSDITVEVGSNPLPIKVVHAGDTHFAHDAADPEALRKAVKETGKNGLMITQGNILDAVSSKFIATNTIQVGVDLDTQELLVRQQLKSLDQEQRLIVTSGQRCHEGWAKQTATHDPARAIVSDETPILFSGGQVIFKDGEHELGRVEVYHNSGSGNTKLSPEGALRARSREKPFGVQERASAFIGAHTHQLVAAQDIVADPISRTDKTVTYGVVGTAKGTHQTPDGFLITLGVPPSNQPADAGQGLVTIWRKKGDELAAYPVAGYDRAEILYQSILFWELANRAHALEDIKEAMQQSGLFPRPEAQIQKEKSLIRHRDTAAKAEGEAPLYKTLAYEIATNLPLRLQFIGNLRVGSGSFERKKLTQVLTDINTDPWAFFFATRRLINQGVPSSRNRDEILAQLGDLLGIANDSLLGIMMTDDLRNNWWTHLIRDEEEIASYPQYPGDWLFHESQVAGTPLILPEVVVPLTVGKAQYVLYLRDQLSHFASLINPHHGLTRVQQVWGG